MATGRGVSPALLAAAAALALAAIACTTIEAKPAEPGSDAASQRISNGEPDRLSSVPHPL
jgi:hypothetical protein